MPSLLRYTDRTDLENSVRDALHEVLEPAPANTLRLVTRKYDTRVTMHLIDDGTVLLACRTTDGDEFTLTCQPSMPFTTLSHILETL